MLHLLVLGKRIGTWVESEQLISEFARNQKVVEVGDENGKTIGHFELIDPSPFPDRAEIERCIAAGGGMPLAEFWKKMGVE